MSDDLSLLEQIDPAVRESIMSAQSNFANTIQNPNAVASRQSKIIPEEDEEDGDDDEDALSYQDDDYEPPTYRFGKQIPDMERSPSPLLSASHDVIVSESEKHKEQFDKRRRYVVEIDAFANDLKLRHTVPAELDLMKMPFEDLEQTWALWDERYNREQTMFVLRHGFAYFGSTLGFSFNKCYRYLAGADYMDMAAWAEHWYVSATVKRPGRVMPFDASLMVMIRKFQWIRDVTAGELSLLAHLINNIQAFKRREDASKKEQERKLQERDDRLVDQLRSEMNDLIQGINKTSEKGDDKGDKDESRSAIGTGGGGGDIDDVMSKMTFDRGAAEEQTKVEEEPFPMQQTTQQLSPMPEAVRSPSLGSTPLEELSIAPVAESSFSPEALPTSPPRSERSPSPALSTVSKTASTARRGRPRAKAVVDLDA